MGEALETAPLHAMNIVAFKFTSTGIKISIPSDQKFSDSALVLEHTKSGKVWTIEKTVNDVSNEIWLIPFKALELNGSYQFRYIDKSSGSSHALGKEIAKLVKTNAERNMQHTLFQRAGELFNAELYIPYTKKSARLRVREAFTNVTKTKIVEHVTIKSVTQKNDEFRVLGTAFVPGIPSLNLQPFLILRNESEDEVLRIPGERKRSMGNQNRYGYSDCDYTDSGYLFRIPKKEFSIDERLKAPCRLKLSISLVSSDGVSYEKTLKATPASLNSRLRTITSMRDFGRKNILSIISASTNDEIFITHRIEEDILSQLNKFKRSLAYKAYSTLGKPESDAWLLYEFESSAAQDNALALFENLRRHRRDLNVKFIIDRHSPDAIKLKKHGRSIIEKYSFRHYWSLLTARILISSQSRYHGYRLAPPKNDPIGREMAKKPFVFLQHGVIALKKISFHRSNPRVSCDLFFSSTKLEQEIICREYGYEPHEVPVVGLPRFDRLIDKSDTTKEILIMPTWRKWLQRANSHSFNSSDFFRNYISFLKNKELSGICEDHGIKLKFYLHPMISKHIDCFKDLPDHIEIVSNGQEPINELMMKASMLVTDYSSVAWDFMYMKKPVAFFHFDLPVYEQVHGAYFDLKKDLGRASAKNPNELIALMKSWAHGEKWPMPTINEFLHTDRSNCSRAIEVIEKLLTKG